jgi:tRNA threonylcarbamoyladenosine modification (KEOPS) complex Cgi121 subunit
MDDYSPAENKFVIKIASSSIRLEKLIGELGKINTKNNVVQIFDPKKVVNKTHLLGAYLNALQSFKNKSNISNSLGIEMLLFAAMTRQINDGIAKIGAKSPNGFIVFADSKASYLKIKKFLNEEEEFNPKISEQMKVAKGFGINQEKELDQFLLQKIAMSRLES